MINTIAALQGLYVALGGDISDVANINTIPDMLEAVASVAGGAGGALPAVTSEDNGDILGVVEGAWAKRDPELPAVTAEDIGKVLTVVSDGEGGATWEESTPNVPVYVSAVGVGSNNVVLGKTSSEIVTLIDSGKDVILVYRVSNDGYPWLLRFVEQHDASNYIFSAVSYINANLRTRFVTINKNNEKASQKDIDITPTT